MFAAIAASPPRATLLCVPGFPHQNHWTPLSASSLRILDSGLQLIALHRGASRLRWHQFTPDSASTRFDLQGSVISTTLRGILTPPNGTSPRE